MVKWACCSSSQGEVGEPGQKGSKADKGEQVRNGKNCLFGPAVIKVLALHSFSLSFNLGVAHILFLRTLNKEGSLICVLCSGSTWSSWSTRPHRSSRSCCKYSITACTAGMKLLQLNLSVKCFKARKKKQPQKYKVYSPVDGWIFSFQSIRFHLVK